MLRKTDKPRDHPRKHCFYAIESNSDGTVDVFLTPEPGKILEVRGIIPWDGMEEEIRYSYNGWLSVAQEIPMEESTAKEGETNVSGTTH